MDTPMVGTRPLARQPLTALGKLTVAALLGLVLLSIYVQALIFGQVETALIVYVAVMLSAAGLVAGYPLGGWRWTPLLGALLSGAIVGGNSPTVIHDLMHPESFQLFVVVVVSVALAVVGLVAGSGAAAQNYGLAQRRTPRWFPGALAGLAGICLGAALVAAIPREAAGSSISPEMLAGLPTLVAPGGFKFDRSVIQAKTGETLALRLDNTSTTEHSFDIDELNVHVAMPRGKSSLALVRPAKPGMYTFYCSLPGHRANGMVGKLIVTP